MPAAGCEDDNCAKRRVLASSPDHRRCKSPAESEFTYSGQGGRLLLKPAALAADTGGVRKSGWQEMSNHNHGKHAVRRIVLPSGRTIEVIRFSGVDSESRELHICPSCECDLVQPISWSETTDGQWDLALECPNCGHGESGTFTRLQVEQLEDHLDEGLTEMIADLQRLTQANMAADVDRFVSALEAGFILPEDF